MNPSFTQFTCKIAQVMVLGYQLTAAVQQKRKQAVCFQTLKPDKETSIWDAALFWT